jgi:hypothetical protein
MTMPDMADRLAEFFSRLYYEWTWARWGVLAIAVIALVLLISTGAGYLQTRARKTKANHAAQTKHWRTT